MDPYSIIRFFLIKIKYENEDVSYFKVYNNIGLLVFENAMLTNNN